MNVKPLSEKRLARRAELADVIRSGKFLRGGHWLQTADNAYCCLGVGCRVAQSHGVKVAEHAIFTDFSRLDGALLFGGVQPRVERYYGFTKREQLALGCMNDSKTPEGRWTTSWDIIADHIAKGDLR